MQTAPFFADVAEGPEFGAAHWLRTADHLRIRAGFWTGQKARATILLFPGRTEYIEKYGRTAAEFLARGYATLSVDWRGQGLADRLHPQPPVGHVLNFLDYQHDVTALLAHARALGLPEPFHLIAHSMGGSIGLRALHGGLPVASAMFSAPMWGIQMNLPTRPFAWAITTLSNYVGMADRLTPGRDTANYVEISTAQDNDLTHDPDMFAYMRRQIVTHPALGLGGPSLRWLHESLIEMHRLSRMSSPQTPALTFLGTKEAIVDPQRIRRRMGAWPGGRLTIVNGGKHEMLLERPEIRNRILAETTAFFDQHGASLV